MIGEKVKILHFHNNNNIVKKIRYIDEYKLNTLFQNNLNEESALSLATVKKLCNFLSVNNKKI